MRGRKKNFSQSISGGGNILRATFNERKDLDDVSDNRGDEHVLRHCINFRW